LVAHVGSVNGVTPTVEFVEMSVLVGNTNG
jgi:hypothetical protein